MIVNLESLKYLLNCTCFSHREALEDVEDAGRTGDDEKKSKEEEEEKEDKKDDKKDTESVRSVDIKEELRKMTLDMVSVRNIVYICPI